MLLCFCFSLNVFCVYYNYLDFRYHWSALDISFFFSTFGLTLALTSGVVIRFLVPKRLSMERGVMLGMFLQVRWFPSASLDCLVVLWVVVFILFLSCLLPTKGSWVQAAPMSEIFRRILEDEHDSGAARSVNRGTKRKKYFECTGTWCVPGCAYVNNK